MDLQEIKEKINLIKYARDYHGLVCNSKGKARCPFHPPDKNPSFTINFDEGIWKWYDPHDQTGGTIVDFECKFSKCSDREAISRLLKYFKDGDSFDEMVERQSAKKANSNYKIAIKEIISYIYRDLDGEEILKKEKRILADGSKKFAWYHKQDSQWKFKKGDHELIPYNLNEFKNHQNIIITEGEKDADTINSLEMGEFATTAPAGASSWPENITRYFEGKEVIFLYDTGVEEEVREHASILKKTFPDMKIFIATVPLKEKNADITDYLDRFPDRRQKQLEFAEIIAKSREFEKKDIVVPSSLLIPVSFKLSEIPSEPIEWLWFNRWPLKKLCLLVGDPGVGKSFFATYMASKITRGEPWPDGPLQEKGSVIYLTVEDDVADTIRPRAEAMGADLEKVYTFSQVRSKKDSKAEFFNIEHNILSLDYLNEQIGDVRLVIIDDVSSFIGKIDMNSTAQVRAALMPSILMARNHRATVLLTVHLNKDKAQKALFRTMGSVAFVAIARAVWAISNDPNDETHTRRFLTSIKTNLSIRPTNLAFRFKGTCISNTVLEFEPDPIDITSEEALSPSEGEEPGILAQTIEWLNQLFADEDEIPAIEIRTLAKEHGFSERTLMTAKKKCNIISKKLGIAENRKWVWIKGKCR